MSPKISICIPTFNRADLLDQTLQSVAAQTIAPYEVIITDNNSTDKTDEVGKKYVEKFGYKYVKNAENIGMIGNWNKAISLATGDYICLLHSDDLISPDWHETWLKVIAEHKADFYTSPLVIINIDNVPLYPCYIFPESRFLKQPEVMPAFLHHLAPMIAPSGASIYTRKIFDEQGYFNPEFGTEADVPYCFKLFTTYDVYYNNHLVFAWRSHDAQTFEKEKQKKTVEGELKRLNNYFSIVSNFYDTHYHNNPKDRLFIQTHAFMTLSSVNLYLAKLKFDKIIGSYKVTHKNFKDLFSRPSDWFLFLKIQYAIFARAIKLKFLTSEERQQLEWLKHITKEM